MELGKVDEECLITSISTITPEAFYNMLINYSFLQVVQSCRGWNLGHS